MRESQCEFAVVGEKNQSLRVMIKPAHGIEVAPFPRQKIGKNSTFLGIAPRRDVAFRFVESDVKLAPRFDRTPIDQDTVLCGINLRAELPGCLSIDLDTSRED